MRLTSWQSMQGLLTPSLTSPSEFCDWFEYEWMSLMSDYCLVG